VAGVTAEVKKVGDRDEWHVYAYTDRLAAGYEKLRKILAEIVKTALARGWVDEKKARRWLEKLEEGLTLKEGWPKYEMKLVEGALIVRFSSPNSDSIAREAQRLRDMGLEEGRHFTVKMPEGGRGGLRLDPQGGLGVRRMAFSSRLWRRGQVRRVYTPEGWG